MIELASDMPELSPRIVVIGVGGAGGNAVASMMLKDVKGVEFIVANTDAQALRASPVTKRIQLGVHATGGLGAGARAELGKAAAEESLAAIEDALDGAHMCFIAAGFGGGTGTGAAPVIAKAAHDKGILTLGVVSKPFAFEGTKRARAAEAGLAEFEQYVDTMIVIPNQNLFRVANPDTTFKHAFDLADEVLQQGVRGITDLMVMPGLINLDFADIQAIMANRGKAMMGSGEATGEDRALRATDLAICNPLLDDMLDGARGLIISISGGEDLRLGEVDEIAHRVKDLVDPDANIIWGSAFDPALEGRIRVSVFATGIDLAQAEAAPEVRPVTMAEIVAGAAAKAAFRAAENSRPAATQLDFPLVAAKAPAMDEELGEDELLLTVERELVLIPPANATAFKTIEPFAYAAAPTPGPSLFERIAKAGRAHELTAAPVPEPFRPRRWAEPRYAHAG